MQLIVGSAKPGSDGVLSAKYWDITVEGSVAFSDICTRLDVSGSLFSSLQETIAISCPNLVNLNSQGCDTILSDLNGMRSIAASCLKLRVLNLLDLQQVESVEEFWVILASMSNLRVLHYLSSDLLIPSDLAVPLPKLTGIAIKGKDHPADVCEEITTRVNHLV